MNFFGFLKPRDPGFRDALGFNPNPLNQPTVKLDFFGDTSWIPFSAAQPPFGATVLVRHADGAIGIGRRTEDISFEARQEKWDCRFLDSYGLGGITHWRPI